MAEPRSPQACASTQPCDVVNLCPVAADPFMERDRFVNFAAYLGAAMCGAVLGWPEGGAGGADTCFTSEDMLPNQPLVRDHCHMIGHHRPHVFFLGQLKWRGRVLLWNARGTCLREYMWGPGSAYLPVPVAIGISQHPLEAAIACLLRTPCASFN
jgi:hypothetical protein